jgi:allantoate deiminase
MSLRRDALVAASEFVVEVERKAARYPTAVATVGRLDVEPGSLTTIPGFVRLTLDTRDIDSDRQRELSEELLDEAWRIAGRRGMTVSASLLSDQSPVTLHRLVREDLARAAESMGVGFAVLPSGATHDTAHIAKLAPAGMIFVPSREGISHAPAEWSDVTDIALGAEVIAAAISRADTQISETAAHASLEV